MTVNNCTPRWPAWAHDRRWAWKLTSIAPLLTVKEDYLLEGELLAVRLLDSDLTLFKISAVRTLGKAGIFGWRPGFKGKYLRVEPCLAFDCSLTLDAAKKYVLDFLSTHPTVYESGIPLHDLTAVIAAADSSHALLAALP